MVKQTHTQVSIASSEQLGKQLKSNGVKTKSASFLLASKSGESEESRSKKCKTQHKLPRGNFVFGKAKAEKEDNRNREHAHTRARVRVCVSEYLHHQADMRLHRERKQQRCWKTTATSAGKNDGNEKEHTNVHARVTNYGESIINSICFGLKYAAHPTMASNNCTKICVSAPFSSSYVRVFVRVRAVTRVEFNVECRGELKTEARLLLATSFCDHLKWSRTARIEEQFLVTVFDAESQLNMLTSCL